MMHYELPSLYTIQSRYAKLTLIGDVSSAWEGRQGHGFRTTYLGRCCKLVYFHTIR